jgi:hypothetical protein
MRSPIDREPIYSQLLALRYKKQGVINQTFSHHAAAPASVPGHAPSRQTLEFLGASALKVCRRRRWAFGCDRAALP